MFALRTLTVLAFGLLAGQVHADIARGLNISTSGDTTTLLVAPLQRGSLGLTMGRLDGGLGITRAEGLNLSVVGQYPVTASLSLEGRLGASYGRVESSPLGALAFGDGLAFGAGLRWNFSPRASALIGWDSQELGFSGAGRETVRSTRLGLQWRY